MDIASPPARPAQSASKPAPKKPLKTVARKAVQPGAAKHSLVAMPEDQEPEQ